MGPQLNPISRLVFVYLIALFWTATQIVRSIYRMFRESGYFHTVPRLRRPAIMDDPELGTHNFIQLSGVRLHYVAAGDPGKPLMLFLHGFPECWFSWRFQLKRFKHNYRVVAVDMRGYGESGKPSGVSSYWLPTLSADIKELIERLGYEKCILVSHDWGGAVAFDTVLRYPHLVDKFIFCNIPHPLSMKENMSLKQLLMSWYMFFFQMPVLPEVGLRAFDLQFVADVLTTRGREIPGRNRVAVDAEELEAFKFSMAQPGCLTSAVNYYRAAMRFKPLPFPEGWTIKVPSCMIWGIHDFALSKPLAEGSIKYFTNLKVNWVNTASHWVQQEEPDKVNEYMAQFLESK